MRQAIDRVKKSGQLDRPDAKPMISKEIETADVPAYYQTALIDFLVPIATLIGLAMIPWILTGLKQMVGSRRLRSSRAQTSSLVIEWGLRIR